MKKSIKSFFGNPSTWLELCFIYAAVGIAVALKASWKLMLVCAVLSGSIGLFSFGRLVRPVKRLLRSEKHIRKRLKSIGKTGDVSRLYRMLDTEILPEIRKFLPDKVYKYYSLGDDLDKNKQKLEAVRKNQIWSSLCSEFNDPYECQYMYLNESDLKEMGLPQEGKTLWDKIMEEIRQRITTICFTQNPNDMPMWAHYANEHKGFCVEYTVDDPKNLYPVFYVDKRLKAQALFVNLVNAFFGLDVPVDERSTLLRFIMLMSAFKDRSWSSENEIRAIFLNSKSDVSNKGKLFSCEEIGIHPVKIYIGAKCTEDNGQALLSVSETLKIECERCVLSSDESFSVIGGST